MKKHLFIKKIRAFTILELSVVMAISGIVFAISYSAYNIINRQYSEFKDASEKIMDVSTLNAVLTKDFFEAKEIRKNGKELLIKLMGGSEVIYRFESDALIRKVNDVNDTFENSGNVKTSFFGKEQTENNGLIDEFYCEMGDKAFPLHIKKYYAADILIELNENK